MKHFLLHSIGKLDCFAWTFVLIFFCISALLFNGSLALATLGAIGIILEMLLIALAIEIIIESLKNTPGIGTLTGFITNGPEAVCLIVGLLASDIVFAASTPLGSNFMNPLLLLAATIITGQTITLISVHRYYLLFSLIMTAVLAASFFLIGPKYYIAWLIVNVIITFFLFSRRPKEKKNENNELYFFNPALWLIPAFLLLTTAGYFLDPVVSYTAKHSHAPKGVIGFFVLATLTSWPEFKSCLALLKREKYLASILNIVVSNITNLWLAAIGIATYILVR